MCNFYMMYSVPLEDEYQLDDQNFQVCDLDPREIESKLTKVGESCYPFSKFISQIEALFDLFDAKGQQSARLETILSLADTSLSVARTH